MLEEVLDSESSKQKSKERSSSSNSSDDHDHDHDHDHKNKSEKDLKIGDNDLEDSHSDSDHEDIDLAALTISDIKRKPWYTGNNDRKLVAMMFLTLSLMAAELFIGFKTGSLALIGDGFHMASDGISLVIAFVAIQMGKRSTTVQHTYGWQRSEVIGSFVNGIFLVSVSLFIALEAIQRFVKLEEVTDPLQVVYVGCGGVLINIIGLIIFSDTGGHGHSHGGGGHGHQEEHGHSHGKKNKKEKEHHGHSHGKKTKEDDKHDDHDDKHDGHDDKHDDKHDHKHDKHDHKHDKHDDKHDHKHDKHGHKHDKHDDKHDHKHDKHDKHDHKHDKPDHTSDHSHDESEHDDSAKTPMIRKVRDDNMRAVFLHVLGDFLGSLAAIASGLLINFLTFPGRYYFDPALSLFIVLLILKTSVPIVRRCILIFMQTVPNFLDVAKLKEDLIKVPGIISMHELHVWTLVGNKTIGSVHITCLDYADFMNIAKKMKKIFHKHQVHSTTIQPEFIKEKVFKRKRERCQLSCLKEENCKTDSCCPATYDDALGEAELLIYKEVTKPRRRFGKQQSINIL